MRAVRWEGKGGAWAIAGLVLLVAMLACGDARAQEGEVEQTPASIARGEVQDAMELLESEIGMLRKLRDAQAALRKWNGVRAGMDEAPAALDRDLCGLVGEWCGALPATFGGTSSGRGAG